MIPPLAQRGGALLIFSSCLIPVGVSGAYSLKDFSRDNPRGALSPLGVPYRHQYETNGMGRTPNVLKPKPTINEGISDWRNVDERDRTDQFMDGRYPIMECFPNQIFGCGWHIGARAETNSKFGQQAGSFAIIVDGENEDFRVFFIVGTPAPKIRPFDFPTMD